jgi:RimJ/RimL family protein N-acetyltransferase
MWELGFWTRTSQQRRGIMRESITALVGWMKQHNPSIEILTRHDVNNTGSIHMIEQLGFAQVDEYTIDQFSIKVYSSKAQGVEV